MNFSIKTILLLMLLVALPIAGVLNRYRGKRSMAEFVEKNKGTVRWNYQQEGWYDAFSPYEDQHSGPRWLRDLWGEDACAWVKRIRIQLTPENINEGNRLLANGSSLRGLTELEIDLKGTGDAFAYRNLAGLRDVRWLSIFEGRLDQNDVAAISRMNDLEIFNLMNCELNVDDIKPLAQAKHLAWLRISKQLAQGDNIKRIRKMLPRTFISY